MQKVGVLDKPDIHFLIATTAVGIVGSVIGGFFGGLIKKPEPGAAFHPAGFALSIIGAVILLLVLRLLQ